MKKKIEGIPGPRRSVGQTMEASEYVPCFETRQTICMTGIIWSVGLTGRDHDWKKQARTRL